MSIEEARKAYLEVIGKLKTGEKELQTLTQKLDAMEAETSILKSKVESCESEEKNIYDSYFLGKSTERDLDAIQKKTLTAKDALSTHSKMIESLARCIKTKENEIPALRKQVDSLRHQVWNSLFAQKSAAIPATVRLAVSELVTIGLNCSRGLHFIVSEVFPLPTNAEIQQIYQRIAAELNIE